jgi:hypothetical protein
MINTIIICFPSLMDQSSYNVSLASIFMLVFHFLLSRRRRRFPRGFRAIILYIFLFPSEFHYNLRDFTIVTVLFDQYEQAVRSYAGQLKSMYTHSEIHRNSN